MRPTVPPDYPDDPIAEPVHRGRGALSNESSRFDSERRIRTTDGWETEATAELRAKPEYGMLIALGYLQEELVVALET